MKKMSILAGISALLLMIPLGIIYAQQEIKRRQGDSEVQQYDPKVKPRMDPKLEPQVRPAPESDIKHERPSITPFKLDGIYYFYANLEKVEAQDAGGAKWTLPVTDGPFVGEVKFLWSFPKVPIEDLKKVVNNKECCFTFLLNGLPVGYTTVSFASNNQLRTAVPFDTSPGGWPKSVKIKMTYQGKTYESHQLSIYSGQTISFFEKYLYPTFQHPRCMDCHSMGDKASIINQHKKASPPINLEDHNIYGANIQPDSTSFCEGCHYGLIANSQGKPIAFEWMSPAFIKGIDWRNKSAKQTCQTVVSKLPKAQALRHHFHDDSRIIWAVSSGLVVPMGYPPLEEAPPKDIGEFAQLIETWIQAGFPCPP